MSFNIQAQAANDPDLQSRVRAAVYAEATNNPALSDTIFAATVLGGNANLTTMFWQVASAVQAAYEAGIASGRGSPGHDQDVVTDGAITSAVVVNWPPDPPVINP
jgi:hypothetical protein